MNIEPAIEELPVHSAEISNAANKVFSITELLEQILLDINDLKTLLLVQRVSTKWRAVIQTNDKLQKKLFFTSCASFEEAKSLGIVANEDLVDFADEPDTDSPATYLKVINTLVFEYVYRHENYSILDYPLKLSNKILPDTMSSRRGVSSWEWMYLTQPPEYGPMVVQHCMVDDDDREVPQRPHSPRLSQTPGTDLALFAYDNDNVEGTPLRYVMDVTEKNVMRKHGFIIKWKDTRFQFCGVIRRWCNGGLSDVEW